MNLKELQIDVNAVYVHFCCNCFENVDIVNVYIYNHIQLYYDKFHKCMCMLLCRTCCSNQRMCLSLGYQFFLFVFSVTQSITYFCKLCICIR